MDVTVERLVVSSRSALDQDQQLTVSIADDGPGGADVDAGTVLRGLTDRWAAVGGDLIVDSPAGRGTTIRALLTLPA